LQGALVKALPQSLIMTQEGDGEAPEPSVDQKNEADGKRFFGGWPWGLVGWLAENGLISG